MNLRRIFTILVFFSVLLGSIEFVRALPNPRFTECAATETIRLLSINLRHGRSPAGESNIDEVVSIIDAVQPDIVALQEVDQGVARSSHRDLPQELAAATGMHSAFEATITSYQGGEYGLLLLSRIPFSYVGRHALPHRRDKEDRIIQEALVTFDSGFTCLIFHTHLSYGTRTSIRVEQVKKLTQRFHGHQYDAIFLVGDLNAGKFSAEHRLLQEEYIDTAPPDFNGTYPPKEPQIQLDHILYQSSVVSSIDTFRTIPEPIISDHRPIWTEIEFCIP